MTAVLSIRSSDVTTEWLKGVLELDGYSVETDPLLADPRVAVLTAKRNDRATFSFSLRPQGNLIAISAVFWLQNRPGVERVTEFLAAVRKANNLNWMFSVSASDLNETLAFDSFIWLCERISPHDIISFVETLHYGIFDALEKSGLTAYG